MLIKAKNLTEKIFKESYKDSLNNSSFTCDLIIKCGRDLHEYTCHRVILASASEFLCSTLSTAVPGHLPVLILPDIEPQTMQQILKYVYNGEITLEIEDSVKFIEGCDLLQIDLPLESNENDVEIVDHPQFSVFAVQSDESEYEQHEEVIEEEGELAPENEENDIVEEEPEKSEVNIKEEGELDLGIESIDQNEAFNVREEGELSADESYNHPEPEKKRQKLMKASSSSSEKPVVGINLSNKREVYLEKAKDCIRQMYNNIDRRPILRLYEIEESIKLVRKGNQLIAEHLCGFCKNKHKLNLYFWRARNNAISIGWNNGLFKAHLINDHDCLYSQ